MIIIFAQENDYSTTKVIEYLLGWKEKVIRINRGDTLKTQFDIQISNRTIEIAIKVNGKYFDLSEAKSIWFRRGSFMVDFVPLNVIRKSNLLVQGECAQYYANENITLNTFIYDHIMSLNINILGNPLVYNTKKLSVLRKAASLGLEIPDTLITTRK